MKLRFATPEDAGQIVDIYAPFVDGSAVSFEERVPSVDEMAERIVRINTRHAWLVCEGDAGVVLGYAYASPHRERAAYRWAVEVSAYVRGGNRKRGVGAALYARLLELLYAQGYRLALAGITLPNEASVAFHERMGFSKLCVYEEIGFKNGSWRDVGWWRRPIAGTDGTRIDAPQPLDPRSWKDLEPELVEDLIRRT